MRSALAVTLAVGIWVTVVLVCVKGSLSASSAVVGTWSTGHVAGGTPDAVVGVDGKGGTALSAPDRHEPGRLIEAQGVGTTYDFRPDGTYVMTYGAHLTFGVLTSATQVTERGHYTFEGTRLGLQPAQYTGWRYVNSPNQRQTVNETRVPARKYAVTLERQTLTLRGPCAKFQVDPYCDESSAQLTLRRAR